MVRIAIPLNPKWIVALIILLAALFATFVSEIGAHAKAQHCVSQAMPIQSGTKSYEPATIACFDTPDEAWNWASQQ